jgi:hypothetical protein
MVTNKIYLYEEEINFQHFIFDQYPVESGRINRNRNSLKNRIECAGPYFLNYWRNIVTSDNQKGSIDIYTDHKKIMRAILLLRFVLPDDNIWLDWGNVKDFGNMQTVKLKFFIIDKNDFDKKINALF